jgi:hypothetical protein
MITEIIRERIVKASLEVNSATENIRRVLRSIADYDARPPDVSSKLGSTPVNPGDLSITRALDLLESELEGLQRELREFRGDEPEQTQATPRYK